MSNMKFSHDRAHCFLADSAFGIQIVGDIRRRQSGERRVTPCFCHESVYSFGSPNEAHLAS